MIPSFGNHDDYASNFNFPYYNADDYALNLVGQIALQPVTVDTRSAPPGYADVSAYIDIIGLGITNTTSGHDLPRTEVDALGLDFAFPHGSSLCDSSPTTNLEPSTAPAWGQCYYRAGDLGPEDGLSGPAIGTGQTVNLQVQDPQSRDYSLDNGHITVRVPESDANATKRAFNRGSICIDTRVTSHEAGPCSAARR